MSSEPIPADGVRRRTWLIVGVLSVVIVLIGAGVALALLANRTPANQSPTFTPAEETSAPPTSTITSPSADASSSVMPTATPSTESSLTSGTAPVVRAGQIVYRKGGALWIANEDGTGARKAIESASGEFSLSPDGRTLAVKGEASSDKPFLVDMTTGVQITVSQAVDLPVWSPDSTWIAYTAGTQALGYSVRLVNRDGTGDALLQSLAAQPQVSVDGKRIAYVSTPHTVATDKLRVLEVESRKTYTVPSADGPRSFAWGAGGVLFFSKYTSSTGTGWLGMADKTLAKSSVIASLPTDVHSAPGPLIPNPGASRVLFSMEGDDGYSKMYMADVAGKKITALANRLDAYPRRWLLNSTGFIFVDGNAIAKDKPNLDRMNADGKNKTVIVQDVRL
jgi:Tol biopolymer transport system component